MCTLRNTFFPDCIIVCYVSWLISVPSLCSHSFSVLTMAKEKLQRLQNCLWRLSVLLNDIRYCHGNEAHIGHMPWESYLEHRSVWSRVELKRKKCLNATLWCSYRKEKKHQICDGENPELGHFELQWEQSLYFTGRVILSSSQSLWQSVDWVL